MMFVGVGVGARCDDEVKPALDGCAMSCHDLDTTNGLTVPRMCPKTCYDCGGWEASPSNLWLVVCPPCIF